MRLAPAGAAGRGCAAAAVTGSCRGRCWITHTPAATLRLPSPAPPARPPPRLGPLLNLLPLPLAAALVGAARFVASCGEVLPQFVSPPLPEALRRAGLVLAVSLVMVVVISSIDSAWLYLYLLRARRLAV